mmetsp:Transcript_78025/g.228724  ORF Transcript_78025/g.228724 Transcript_78025/m.228724 type:complete len:202 (+) Transcript_78025:6-611(+)
MQEAPAGGHAQRSQRLLVALWHSPGCGIHQGIPEGVAPTLPEASRAAHSRTPHRLVEPPEVGGLQRGRELAPASKGHHMRVPVRLHKLQPVSPSLAVFARGLRQGLRVRRDGTQARRASMHAASRQALEPLLVARAPALAAGLPGTSGLRGQNAATAQPIMQSFCGVAHRCYHGAVEVAWQRARTQGREECRRGEEHRQVH